MLYRLFAFDLDGTLLAQDGTIPPGTKEFLTAARGQAKITLVTGRSLASAQRYIREIEITCPVVLYHGAVVWDPSAGKPVLERTIPPELARRALAMLESLPVHVQVYLTAGDPTVYVARVTAPIQRFLDKENLPVKEVALTGILARSPLKLLAIGEPEILATAEDALRETLPELTVVRSEREYVEVLPPGVSKGEGLAWLCAHLGIRLQDVVAVGDQMSDLSMIERAGLGVAMAHGPATLRERADLVVGRVEEIRDALGLAREGKGVRCRSPSG
ncbi:MAG TPA: HAD family phosphatase [Candidatus Acetothermia bacterium]|nr:HAD family phosphatase [Candidatus Acetothermia bacterium]